MFAFTKSKPTGSEESCITIGVRGRWTANWVRVLLSDLDLVDASTRAHIRRGFHLFCRWQLYIVSSVLPRP